MAHVKPIVDPTKPKLTDAIVRNLVATGRANFDFGVFRLYKRDGGKIKLVKGDKAGKVRATRPYVTVFFRASDTLKRALKKATRKP